MRIATHSITVQNTPAGIVATATFPAGLFAARRPIVGQPAATNQAAIASLLAMPKLHVVLASIVNPPVAPDFD